mgnify:FL=1|tara:strand:- start:2670 stop:5108 length:2439 start_codon:yes stop_codon:yes gene_type:complete
MYNNDQKSKLGFPNPLEPTEVKEGKDYGIQYAKAIESQWGRTTDDNSLVGKRNRVFEKDRDYAIGVQDTSIYKQLLNSLQPNKGDGSLLNMDYTPVPILPKFVRIVVNKILSVNPYPNLEAVDPLSSSQKNEKKKKIIMQVKAKQKLIQLKAKTGVVLDLDPDQIPDTPEEAEILFDTNIKTDAEISAQIGTDLTLTWNNFIDNTFRRCVNDLATLGMSVVKRSNDPNEGIKTSYVDPCMFIHSYTEDPNFEDLMYAGHIKKISIQELKRISAGELTEEDFEKIAEKSKGRNGNDSSKYNKKNYSDTLGGMAYGYDDYMVEVLDFEFISVDCIHFEEKENKHGNTGFYFKGYEYKEPKNSVFERTPHKLEIATVYGGSYVLGCEHLFGYGKTKNVPKNIHDISKAKLSYSVTATNLRNMMPKSMVDSCVGFADMLQITHLKIQQSIAKAKPDGLIIDIEGLENVQLGKSGELQPLDLHDIYEQTGVFYYRSKNPEGGFQNPPVREIGNSIRNINELIGLYNHYLRLIRDATGINEAMDASSPKGEALVGVQQQAIAAGNNAIYDITNASMLLFKKVCEDIVKCMQIIPLESVLYKIYENAIGDTNMEALTSFRDLPMYNFGVVVVKDMEEKEKAYLEQNIQMALQQQEIDLEDAISVRGLKDVSQAERLLVVRRKKRMAKRQEMAMQNSEQQAQMQAQIAQQSQQAKMSEMQAAAQLEAQKIQMQSELDMKMEQMKHEFKREIEMIKAQATLGFKEDDKEFKEKLEVLKETRKDDRLDKQTSDQSKLISQRQGNREELPDSSNKLINALLGE